MCLTWWPLFPIKTKFINCDTRREAGTPPFRISRCEIWLRFGDYMLQIANEKKHADNRLRQNRIFVVISDCLLLKRKTNSKQNISLQQLGQIEMYLVHAKIIVDEGQIRTIATTTTLFLFMKSH